LWISWNVPDQVKRQHASIDVVGAAGGVSDHHTDLLSAIDRLGRLCRSDAHRASKISDEHRRESDEKR